jgi:hypothetical protein
MQGYWVCDACLSLNDPRYGACYKCHVKRGEAKPRPIIPGATVGEAASDFYGSGGRVLPEPNLRLALIVGGIVAILATGAWYWLEATIHFGRGYLAAGVGLAIALAVVIAGTIGGRRRMSYMLPVISFVLTLTAVVAGEYLIISSALATAAGIDAGAVPIAQPQDVARVAGDFLGSDPIRPLLWFVALAEAWLVPWGALAGRGAGPDPERRDWTLRH